MTLKRTNPLDVQQASDAPTKHVFVREMLHEDMQEVLSIQSECYRGEFLESLASFESKWFSSPKTCFVAVVDAAVQGYLVAIPTQLDQPPCLGQSKTVGEWNSGSEVRWDCLHLHDMAVRSAARGLGLGKLMVEAFFQVLRDETERQSQQPWSAYSHASLIAVQDSQDYWARFGFRPRSANPDVESTLAMYGRDAVYMTLAI